MEDLKKRRLDEDENGQASSTISEEQLRSLLDPLAKSQLIDFLAKLGTKYSPVAGEIISVASADPVHRKLFVRGLAWNTSSETLCAAFQVHGEIEEGAVIHDKVTGKSRGYGFITYSHMESAQAALKAPNKLIDGRLAVCNLACVGLNGASTAVDQAQRKLYVGGLSTDTSSEMLLNFFGRHGEIEEGSVAYDKDTNKSRGFGFVTYKTVEGAKKALNDPERTLGGRNITVKYADNKNKTSLSSRLPPSVAPMAMPGSGVGGDGYHLQPWKPQASSASPLGYGFAPPQAFPSSYQGASYLPAVSGSYPGEPQIRFGSGLAKKDVPGMPPTGRLTGMPGYPYYTAKR